MKSKINNKGQVGIGSLIVFLSLVLVAAIAAGVFLQTGNLLQDRSQTTADESTSEVSNRLVVADAEGSTDSSGQVDDIELTIRRASGAGNIDLSRATISYLDKEGSADLTYSNSSASASEFAVSSIQDVDGSIPVVSSSDDRFTVKFALNGTTTPALLTERDEVTLDIVTESGATVTETLVVPDFISSDSTFKFE